MASLGVYSIISLCPWCSAGFGGRVSAASANAREVSRPRSLGLFQNELLWSLSWSHRSRAITYSCGALAGSTLSSIYQSLQLSWRWSLRLQRERCSMLLWGHKKELGQGAAATNANECRSLREVVSKRELSFLWWTARETDITILR